MLKKAIIYIFLLWQYSLNNYANCQQNYFFGISSVKIYDSPNLNYGLFCGTNIHFNQRNGSKKFLNLGLKHYFDKKYEYKAIADAKDTALTNPDAIEINSIIKIGYSSVEFGGIFYIYGEETADFSLYTKGNLGMIIANYKVTYSIYDTDRYEINDHQLISYNPKRNKTYNSIGLLASFGLGIEKKIGNLFLFSELIYAYINKGESNSQYSTHFKTFGNNHSTTLNIGLKILKN